MPEPAITWDAWCRNHWAICRWCRVILPSERSVRVHEVNEHIWPEMLEWFDGGGHLPEAAAGFLRAFSRQHGLTAEAKSH